MSGKDSRPRQQLQVPARYYLRLLELIEEENTNTNQIVAACGLDRATLAETDAMLSWDKVEILIEEALSLRNKPGLGLDLGKRIRPTSHSFVGFALLSSPNIDYALRLLARYFSLIMPSFRLRYGRADEQLTLDFMPQISMSPGCLDFHIETIAAAVHWEMHELLLGDMPAYELLLSIDPPMHQARYAELREARTRFASLSQPGLGLRIPNSIAGRPLAMADSNALDMAEARCQALVSKAVAKHRVREWIEMVLRESHDGMPNLEELAQTLNLSSRTLDRHLKREGEGFRELRKRVQHEKACALLSDEAQAITQIALELGYSDAANFTRAFKRQTGLSPRAWREQQPNA